MTVSVGDGEVEAVSATGAQVQDFEGKMEMGVISTPTQREHGLRVVPPAALRVFERFGSTERMTYLNHVNHVNHGLQGIRGCVGTHLLTVPLVEKYRFVRRHLPKNKPSGPPCTRAGENKQL